MSYICEVKMKLKPILNKMLFEQVNLESGIKQYVEKLNNYSKEYFKKNDYKFPPDVYENAPGKRWNKIVVRNNGGQGQKSVFAFIDTNGDIYKPAGWNAPAKGVRGNIFDSNPPLDGRSLYR